MNKIILLILFFSVASVNAQSSWKKIEPKNYKAKTELANRKTVLNKFDLYTLNTDSFKNSIENEKSITIPVNGELANFSIKESSSFTNTVAKEYGYIKSFSLKGIDDKTATGKISIGTDGVHVIIFSGLHSTTYIDPYTKNKSTYLAYNKNDILNHNEEFECLIEDQKTSLNIHDHKKVNKSDNANDGVLRSYRFALACTIEYADFHINNQGIPNTASDATKKAAVLSAMNTTMTRINGIFEKDLGVTFNIVLNSNGENDLIFIDSDDLSNDNATLLLDESQAVCDDIIGSENYDIGHTFSTGAGGLAYLGVLCNNNTKAGGVTGRSIPLGDKFDLDLVAHEIGHQLGANHSYNNSCDENRNNNTAVEPGSGSTIMGYAGICVPNVQENSDDYFHAISIDQMWNLIRNSSCGSETITNNTTPEVNAGADVSVPKSTPLILRGNASDDDNDNDSLTYCWEQTDIEIATMPPLETNLAGPAFRSLPPTSSPDRYLPMLSTVIQGNTSSEWEVIPSVAREMNFSLVVRDNNTNGGTSERDDIKITVIDTDPFIVTSPNTNVSWEVGITETITWDVSTTNQAPINCENVRIKLSTDGGETFPFTLVESTPNDGNYNLTVPNQLTDMARIMVEGIDNIFYNVNSTNFSILSSGPTFIMSNSDSSDNKNVCNDDTSSVTYNFNTVFINDFDETVTFSIENLPEGVTANFSNQTITNDESSTITISNFNTADIGTYTPIIRGSSLSVQGSIELPTLKVFSTDFQEVNLSSPTNNIVNSPTLNPSFTWTSNDINALNYSLEIALDNSFTNIIINEDNITTTSFALDGILDWATTFYWRVKPKNICGEGNYSQIFSFTTEDSGYCQSTFTQTTDSEFISNVSFGSINNDSGDDSLNPVPDGYEDFTEINTSLVLGETQTLSVTLDPIGFQDHCYAFIDWDGDTRFNTDNERYDLGSHFISIATATSEITVPEDAAIGQTRMRIIIEYFDDTITFGTGACDTDHNSEFGETEDYTLNIVETANSDNDNVFNNFRLGPNPLINNSNLIIAFDIPNTNEIIKLNISDNTGRIIKTFNYRSNGITFFNESIPKSELQLQSGLYFLNIKNGNKETSKKIIID